MKDIILTDACGNNFTAHIIFTHFSNEFNKNYVIYEANNELFASSYQMINDDMIISSDLTEEEYDMIDKIVALRMGDLND